MDVNLEYCIMTEMPYCPVCQFGGIDTSDCETREDADNAPWYCSCTKEKYDKYVAEHILPCGINNKNDREIVDTFARNNDW